MRDNSVVERIALQSALDDLADLDQWLMSLEIPLREDRCHAAAAMVRKSQEQRVLVEAGGRSMPIGNYVPGLFEALELLLVKRAFSRNPSPVLREKLLRAVSGPVSPAEETAKNSGARNTMFELTLAADFKTSGADVELSSSDFLLRLSQGTFANECKRPFSTRSVRANVHEAASQLATLLDSPEHVSSFGVIAVSLNRVFNPNARPWRAPEGLGVQRLNEELMKLIYQYKHEWKWDTKRFHPRIAAVMFHIAVPWDISGERLIYLSTRRFFRQAKCPAGFHLLETHVPKLYAS
jgi:hypothetical protein